MTDTVIRARPHRGFWGFVLVLTGLAVLCALTSNIPDAKGHTTPFPVTLVLTSLLAAGSIATAFWLLSHEIRADTEGLHWRDRHGRYRAVWSEVADYYLSAPAKEHKASSTAFCLALNDGREVRFGNDWQNAAALCAFVRRHARATETNEWAVKGTRLCDLPQTFTYSQTFLRRQQWGLAGAACLFVGLLVPAGIYVGVDEGRQGHLFTAAFWSVFVLIPLAFPLSLLWEEWQALREAERRVGEEWTLWREGFVFRDKSGEASWVRWETIVGFDFTVCQPGKPLRRKPSRLRTADGREFSFTYVTGVRRLQTILRQRAVDAIETKIDFNSRDAIGGVAARWTGGVEGVGDRVFSARTRSNRFYLCLPFLVALAPVINLTLMHYDLTVSQNPIPWRAVLVFCVLAFAVGAFAYRTVRVVIGAEKLTYQPPFAPPFQIVWKEIQQVRSNDGWILIERANQPVLKIPVARLSYGSEILPILEDYLRRSAQSREGDSLPRGERISRQSF